MGIMVYLAGLCVRCFMDMRTAKKLFEKAERDLMIDSYARYGKIMAYVSVNLHAIHQELMKKVVKSKKGNP